MSRVKPRKSVDTLAAMHRRGSITSGRRGAGERFQELFLRASLDPLKAYDAARVVGRGQHRPQNSLGNRIEDARSLVWSAVHAAGGLASPGGSVLWHVCGTFC